MNRLLTLIPVLATLATSVACGSTSSSTNIGPSPVRCAVAATPNPSAFPPAGGAGNLVVSAARECSWTASSQAGWIALTAPVEGQGDGSVRFTVAQNPVATARRGTLVVGSQNVDVTQEAAPCRFELDRRSFDLAANEGTGTINVGAPSGCAWTAASQAAWITIEEGAQGNGPGRVRFRAAANTGTAARSGALQVAGHRVDVRQRAPGAPPPPPPPPGECSYDVEPDSADAPPEVTDGAFAVRTDLGCSWTATSDQPWLTVVSAATGTGPQLINYRASANDGTSDRIAHITVNGAVFTLRQSGSSPPQCNFDLDPNSDSAPASGETGQFDVRTGPLCVWNASAPDDWIDITSGSAGVGDGRVEYRVDANTSSSSRTGTITVADRQFTITQEGAAPQEPITINGDVQNLAGSCPDRTFTIGNQNVRTTSSTDFDDGDCEDLRDNRSVQVRGIVGSDNVLTADEVQF